MRPVFGCDITKDELGIDWEPEESEDFEIYTMEKNGGVLPDTVQRYLGSEDYKVEISTTNSKLPSNVTSDSLGYLQLVTLNDHYRLNFNQIADIIEEEFLSNDLNN